MKKILLIVLLTALSSPAHAAKYYFRPDGGLKTECTGLVDAPKNASKACAWNANTVTMEASTTPDEIIISKGQFQVSIQPPPSWISMSEFFASPKKYTDLVVKGRRVLIHDYNGRNFEVSLR